MAFCFYCQQQCFKDSSSSSVLWCTVLPHLWITLSFHVKPRRCEASKLPTFTDHVFSGWFSIASRNLMPRNFVTPKIYIVAGEQKKGRCTAYCTDGDFARKFECDDDDSCFFRLVATLFQKLHGAQQKVRGWGTTVAPCFRAAMQSCQS